MKRIFLRFALATGFISATLLSATAALVDVGPLSITPAASVIRFDSWSLGIVNRTYNFRHLPGIGTGTFLGQTVTSGFPVALSDWQPGGPLSLNLRGPRTYMTNGSASDSNPVLIGWQQFNGPMSILFGKLVAGVALKGGFSVDGFDANGTSLGNLSNTVTGFQFYGLADSTGKAAISGLSFFATGNERAGLEIDDVTCGSRQAFTPVPEASGLILIAGVCIGTALMNCTRRRAKAYRGGQ